MKQKFKLLAVLLAFVPFGLKAAEYSKKIHQGYLKSNITALNVSNKFGTVEVNNMGGDSVTVDVTITVETVSEARAKQLIDLISININRSGGLLRAQTVINEDFKSKMDFSIDYKINIPKDRSLNITNKFGNIAVQELDAPGAFNLAYGNITAGSLNAPGDGVMLELAYGKADLESVNKMVGEIKYSKVFIGQAGNLNMTTRYSGLNVDDIQNLTLESKYDGVKLGRVSSISAESKYSNYTIDVLAKTLKIETEYGSVRVGKVLPDFSNIEIYNSYGGITLGMNELSYMLTADCNYCDVKYPTEKFQGNRSKENANVIVQGKVGSATGTQQVVIKSRYGGISLK